VLRQKAENPCFFYQGPPKKLRKYTEYAEYCNCIVPNSDTIQTYFELCTFRLSTINGATDKRHVLVNIGLYCLYFEPDTGISIFLVGEKIHCLGFGFTNEKINVIVFFLQYSQISCVSETFLVGSVI
jgi:hypothetical protein